MALNLTKTYTPASGNTANSTAYNTDIAALFNAFSGLEAQTSTLNGLKITPNADSTSVFQVTNAATTEYFRIDTTNQAAKFFNTKNTITSSGAMYIAPGTGTLTENMLTLTGGGTNGTYGFLVEKFDGTDMFFIDTKNVAIFIAAETLPTGTGVYNLGNAVQYWADVSYKTLTDRGCLGSFDDGVELQDGTKVSDTEALLAIQKHPTKKTVYGVDMLDYKTFPKVSYKKAETKMDGVLLRDKDDEPIGGSDGIEMTSMFSIMIGAIRELTNRVKALEEK